MSTTTTPPWKKYNRKAIPAEMYPWVEGVDMEGMSISEDDVDNGSPKEGDLIARAPDNHHVKWLVNAAYFADHFDTTPLDEP